MATQKIADAAPAVAPAEAATEEQRQEQEKRDRQIKPVVAPPPAPGQSVADQEADARARNPQAGWLDGVPRNAWFTTAAADTKDAVLRDMAQGVLGRFNADSALAAGRAVTREWINAQILTYQLPITEEDVRRSVEAALGEAGIQVQG